MRRFVRRNRLGLLTAVGLVVLAVGFVSLLEYSRPHVDGDALRYDEFVDLVSEGAIIDARILDEDAYVVGRYLGDDGTRQRYRTPLVRTTQGRVADQLAEFGVPTTVDQQVGKRVAALASILLPGLILIVLFVYLIISFRRGSGLFSITSGARRITGDAGAVSFADVAGQDDAVHELRELTDYLSDPQRYTALGVAVPRGVLLYGPPGCGKTLMARALAAESGASFYSISGSDFVELYVGVGAARVRELFREARENAPAIVFIDELDSVGRSRVGGGTVASNGEQEQALNQILAEMDGITGSQGVIVVGATNRPDVLDPALLRPGRFDRTIGLERPGEAARLAILRRHAEGKPLADDTDLAAIASHAIGLTGADLASVVNEGALLAARARRGEILQGDLDEALERILEAPERQRRLSLRDRSVVARHSPTGRVTFADVAGADDAVAELREVSDYLAEPERFTRIGARVPRGVLLHGLPGCGKTLLARAVAGEANAAFFSVAASEFVEVFVGEGAARVRDLFAEARAVAPAIVFIDEIDALGARRQATATGGSRETEQTLNQILVELDGFDVSDGVIVIAATNRPDVLDPALVRSGRFDRRIAVDPPDRAGRRAILELHTANVRLSADVDLDVVASLTRGFTGADLATVVNEAALLTARRGHEVVSMEAFEEGIDRAVLGVASRGMLMSPDERRVVAYHEAGHALVARALPGAMLPHKLTIAPRGRTLGHCQLTEVEERVVSSESMLLDRMAGLLGGRVAEELVFDDRGAGAAGDLERATEIARTMVCELGMSQALGPLAYGRDGRPGSEEEARLVFHEQRRLVEEAQQRARGVLTALRDSLDRLAEALLEHETLTASQIEQLAGPVAAPATQKLAGDRG